MKVGLACFKDDLICVYISSTVYRNGYTIYMREPIFYGYARRCYMEVIDYIRKALLAGFGFQDKVKELADELVEKGELSQSDGAKLVKEWSEKATKSTDELNQSLSSIVDNTLKKMNIPTREEMDKIAKNQKTLTARIKKMESTVASQEKGG